MDIEKIHQYLAGHLSKEATDQFEQSLEKDASLRMEVQIQKEMLSHLSVGEEIEASKRAIQDVHQSYASKTKKNKTLNIKILSALAIAASLALFFIIRSPNQTYSNDEIFQEYFTTPTASFQTKGHNDEEILIKASAQYNVENYQEALTLFDQYIEQSNTVDGEVLFYQAICNSALGNNEIALNQLQGLKSDFPLFAVDADWYTALLLIKTNRVDEAKIILESFTTQSYADKKEEIKLKLEKLK